MEEVAEEVAEEMAVEAAQFELTNQSSHSDQEDYDSGFAVV